jgi:hypothetical protein
MNNGLAKLNDNYGIVSDEKGNIKVVNKKNNYYELQDILIKENEIEKLNKELEDAVNDLSTNKFKIISSEILNIVILGGEIYLFIIFNMSPVNTSLLLACLAMFYISTKGLILSIFGTRIGRFKKRKKLINTIKELEETIPKLEKELENIKKKVEYSTYSETKLDNNMANIYQDLDKDESIISDKTNVKILKLTKK